MCVCSFVEGGVTERGRETQIGGGGKTAEEEGEHTHTQTESQRYKHTHTHTHTHRHTHTHTQRDKHTHTLQVQVQGPSGSHSPPSNNLIAANICATRTHTHTHTYTHTHLLGAQHNADDLEVHGLVPPAAGKHVVTGTGARVSDQEVPIPLQQ